MAAETSCTLPGIYSAEVPGGLEVDLLLARAAGIPRAWLRDHPKRAPRARSGLRDGDIDRESSRTVVLRVTGSAERDDKSYPLEALSRSVRTA